MWNPFSAIKDAILAIVVALVVGAITGWAGYFYGIGIGEDRAENRLDAASRKAQQEISNEADRFRFARTECRNRGDQWVFDFASGECVRKPAN